MLRLQDDGTFTLDGVTLRAGDIIEVRPHGIEASVWFIGNVAWDGSKFFFAWPDSTGKFSYPMPMFDGQHARFPHHRKAG